MKMTKEEKMQMLTNMSDEQVVGQLRWAITLMNSKDIDIQAQGNEDYELITAEILRRMAK